MKGATGILYIRSQNDSELPSDGAIEQLIEEAYPGILASITLKEMPRP